MSALNTSSIRFDGCGINDGDGQRFATVLRENWNKEHADLGSEIERRYNSHEALVSALQDAENVMREAIAGNAQSNRMRYFVTNTKALLLNLNK